ncbi:MAG: ATP-binding protein, partial [Planctomycetota bacterium]
AEGRFVQVGVTDNGPGMTPEVRRHALDPFYTTKKRGLSTGLGLSLVHGVAKAAGGSVEIESSPHRGTTVVLTLPAADGAALAAPAPTEVTGVASISLEDRRMAAYASVLLSSAGFDVRSAPPDGAADTRLWITEPSEAALREARRFLDGRPERRVIFVGRPLPGPTGHGILTVDVGGGSEAMRRVLRKVVLELAGGS